MNRAWQLYKHHAFLPRVVKLPEELCGGADGFVFLSSILHEYVYKLFRGMKVKSCHQFRLTRDSDLTVEDDEFNNLTNLRTVIQSELHDRDFGAAVRLEVADNCPNEITQFLLARFDLTENELYRVNGPVNLVRLMAVPDMVERPELKFPSVKQNYPTEFRKVDSLLNVIRQKMSCCITLTNRLNLWCGLFRKLHMIPMWSPSK